MIVLGIDTSFDDTSIALVEDGRKILTNLVISQIKEHKIYGGVIPERASRKHLEIINPLLQRALDSCSVGFEDIDGVAVANRPGLLGSLLVGVCMAKSLAYALDKPFVGVHHIESHIYANFLHYETVEFPQLCLVVSGGHTLLIRFDRHLKFGLIGTTTDDAAGEAFDKVSRAMELGIPGGPVIDNLSKEGDPTAFTFPRPRITEDNFDFSFSGLKTSVFRFLEKNPSANKADVAASFQAAVADVLVTKTMRAAEQLGISHVSISGGVSANSYLRQKFAEAAQQHNLTLYVPPLKLCTDNAAMVAALGYFLLREGITSDYLLDAIANEPISR